MKRPAPPSVPRGAPVVNFLEGMNSNDSPCVWGFRLLDSIVQSEPIQDLSAAQPPVEPSHFRPDPPTTPFTDCTSTLPEEDDRPTPCRSPRPSHLRPTPLGPSAASLTASGPCAAYLTTPGPRAVCCTPPGPSADFTATTDLGDCSRLSSALSSAACPRDSFTDSTPSFTPLRPFVFVDSLTDSPASMIFSSGHSQLVSSVSDHVSAADAVPWYELSGFECRSKTLPTSSNRIFRVAYPRRVPSSVKAVADLGISADLPPSTAELDRTGRKGHPPFGTENSRPPGTLRPNSA